MQESDPRRIRLSRAAARRTLKKGALEIGCNNIEIMAGEETLDIMLLDMTLAQESIGAIGRPQKRGLLPRRSKIHPEANANELPCL